MKTLSRLGEDVDIQIEETPSHRGNEAELTKAVIRYRANGVTLEKPVLLRECLLGDKGVHNAEIRDIYDRLRAINAAYSQEGKPYRINVVRHFTDDSGNIYVKDLNPGGEVYAHDLLPDPNYFDEGMKPKSRFGEFKRTLGELNLNRSEIIRSVFEQLAILHSNGFVVGTIVRGEREVTHPTLSLFICRLKNKRSEEGVKLFIHDIHNLVEFPETGNAAYVSHAVRDLRDLAFDIIRFFKGIGLPQWGFRVYGNVLKELNPELYRQMYSAFLWNPGVEVESRAMSRRASEAQEERRESRQVVSRVAKDVESSLGDHAGPSKKLFGSGGIFVLGSRKAKILRFLEETRPDNTEFIFDFDGTLTLSGSKNALRAALREDETFSLDEETSEGFTFRKGAIAFLRLLLAAGFDVKIYSLGFQEVILEVLRKQGVDISPANVFANRIDFPVVSKSEVALSTHPTKRQVLLGDNPADFAVETPNGSLRIGFQNSQDALWMNGATDFYHLPNAGDFIFLYHTFRRFFGRA